MSSSRLRTNIAGTGFTLVEMLVVVAVIALLIAMLMPALNRAKYQTKLAVCQATLKGLGTASVTYATDNFSYYPTALDPPDNNPSSWFWTTWQRSWEWSKRGNPSVYDLRPVYREYLGGELDKTVKCPLATKYFADRKLDDLWLSNYMLFATNNHKTKHFYFNNDDAPIVSTKMNRTWSLTRQSSYRFSLIASDVAFGSIYGYNGGSSGHPAPNGFERYVGGPINDFPGYGIGNWQKPIYEAPINYLNGDGAVHMYKTKADSYRDQDTWVASYNYNFILPKDLAK